MGVLDDLKLTFELQDKMNTLVNPNWKTAGYPWYRAAWIEAAELMDHANYKWWKNLTSEPDREQILLELVDIYHFLVSDMLVDKYHYSAILSTYDRCKSLKPMGKEDRLREIESFCSVCLENNGVFPLDFCRLVVAFGFTLEEVLRWYIAKNTLNIFRQNNGYKTGEYIKEWNGVEDNVVLAAYVESHPEIKYDELYSFLENSYKKLKGE